MGIVITPKEKIDEYFNSSAVNQSLLKRLEKGVHNYLGNKKSEKELYYTEKGHFIIGSAVDTILTGEENQFEKDYYVSELDKKPSEVEMSIIQKVFDEVVWDNNSFLEDFKEQIEQSILFHNWQPNWKIETKINKIVEIGSDYFEDLKQGYGKQILSTEEYSLINNIVLSLTTNPRTNKYFNRQQLCNTDLINVYYQLPIYFTYNEIDCKALLDLLILIRNEKGEIVSIQGFDLKTTSTNTIDFANNVKKYRYDIQASWYMEAIKQLFVTKEHYNLKPFTFIVESTTNIGFPLLYECTDLLISAGKHGIEDYYFEDLLVLKGCKGFIELLNDYKYQEENEWLEDQIVTYNNGILKICYNGIV